MEGNNKVKNQTDKKVLILAVDGMDPKVVNKGIADKLLPNLAKLKDSGFYSELQTTVPPQSPVAWASFITGASPVKHKIYDFIGRNADNYNLQLNFSDSPPHQWEVKPFWEYLTENNIESTILFLPDTYPLPKKHLGKMVAGMGVPDILGTQGTLTLFTTKEYPVDPNWKGKMVKIDKSKTINTNIEGPKVKLFSGPVPIKIPLTIESVNDQELILTVDKQKITVKTGEFSSWIKLKFSIDFLNKVNGIVRFYLKSVKPDVELYLSPINFDPDKQLHPISYPGSYLHDLVKENGHFSNLGFPVDSWAYDQDIFDEKAFLTESDEVFNEREKIYFNELAKWKKGVFLYYFGSLDTLQHMFWDNKNKGVYPKVIMDYYKRIDGIVGKTLERIDDKTTLIILSDHGFDSFDYEFNLNRWLMDKGYLAVKEGSDKTAITFDYADWDKTSAYGVGYNGIYINLKNREKNGIVEKKDYQNIVSKISKELLVLVNPLTSQPVVKKVYTKEELGISESDNASPDIFVGFYKGIRTSWDSAVGGLGDKLIKIRQGKWSGDHLFDPSEIPGVLFSNLKLEVKNPRIIDIIPSVYGLFGLDLPADIEGKEIKERGNSSGINDSVKENLKSLPY